MNVSPAATDLIERAFHIARQSGKSDWWIMALPVLKNRILLLTKQTFKEADYGAVSFRDFLRKNPEVVTLDEASSPGFVILKSEARANPNEPPPRPLRGDQVRPDLWRGILDYSSGRRYVWDLTQQVARVGGQDDPNPTFPTLSGEAIAELRLVFFQSLKLDEPEEARRVEEWSKTKMPTAALPAAIRPLWNKFLKRDVQRRVQEWFEASALPLPDIVEKRAELDRTDQDLELLRGFVMDCVRGMSKQELSDLRISPEIALRVTRGRKNDGDYAS